MHIVAEVAGIAAPVFVLAAIGLVWVRSGLDYDVTFVTRLAMGLGIPCLIFTALVRSDVSPATLGGTAAAALTAYGGIAAVWAVLIRLAGAPQRTWLAPLTFGNTGNLGLPLALFAFGEAGLDLAVIVFAAGVVVQFTAGIRVVAGRGAGAAVAREPMVWATLLGVLFLGLGWDLPAWAFNSLDLVGQIGIPLMLMTLGVAIARLRPGAVLPSLGLSAAKVALCAAVALGAGALFDLPPLAQAVLVVQLSTPVPVTAYMLAEKYGADGPRVAGLVVVSTALSVVTLPLLLAFFI